MRKLCLLTIGIQSGDHPDHEVSFAPQQRTMHPVGTRQGSAVQHNSIVHGSVWLSRRSITAEKVVGHFRNCVTSIFVNVSQSSDKSLVLALASSRRASQGTSGPNLRASIPPTTLPVPIIV